MALSLIYTIIIYEFDIYFFWKEIYGKKTSAKKQTHIKVVKNWKNFKNYD